MYRTRLSRGLGPPAYLIAAAAHGYSPPGRLLLFPTRYSLLAVLLLHCTAQLHQSVLSSSSNSSFPPLHIPIQSNPTRRPLLLSPTNTCPHFLPSLNRKSNPFFSPCAALRPQHPIDCQSSYCPTVCQTSPSETGDPPAQSSPTRPTLRPRDNIIPPPPVTRPPSNQPPPQSATLSIQALLTLTMFEQQDQDRDKDRLRHHAIPPSPARPDLALGGSDSAHSSSPPRRPSRNRANSASTSSHPTTMPQYTSRDVGDPTQIKKNKQSMADLKLRRLTELNNRLREDLERERIPVSQASKR